MQYGSSCLGNAMKCVESEPVGTLNHVRWRLPPCIFGDFFMTGSNLVTDYCAYSPVDNYGLCAAHKLFFYSSGLGC